MTIGIIMAVMLPIMIVIAAAWLAWRNKQQGKGRGRGLSSWQFAKGDSPDTPLKGFVSEEVDSVLDPPSPPLSSPTNTDTLSPPASTPSPKENSPPVSTLSSRGSKSRRSYDKVYRTHEPLPGKPAVEFENKVWDLDEETDTSWTPSPKDSGTFRSSILSTPMQSPRSSQVQPSTSTYAPVYQTPETKAAPAPIYETPDAKAAPPKRQTLV